MEVADIRACRMYTLHTCGSGACRPGSGQIEGRTKCRCSGPGTLQGMPTAFVVSLGAIVVAILAARVMFAALPLRVVARPVTAAQMAFTAGGLCGLLFHCIAMFARSWVQRLPGTGTVLSQINALGAPSVVWYTVPAVLVLVGLRRQHPTALAVVALALIAVGVTMYDNGSLRTHLIAIFLTVLTLTFVLATLVQLPRQFRTVGLGRK